MPFPNLTFFCELDPDPLNALISDSLIADLKSLNARVSLGLRDFSPERAQVVRRLNLRGIPVVAWILLPLQEGYWLNLRNSTQANQRYAEFREWTNAHALKWAGVGLDIEPDWRDISSLSKRNWRVLPQFFLRLFARMDWRKGLAAYRRLIRLIHDDGFVVETYQFPLIDDERKARSSLLQRLLGIVDLPTDREVWMLYSSFVRPHGPGVLASYAPQAQTIAIGSTGGGMDVEFGDFKPLTKEEFARDLHLSWYYCNDLYIFSLEGCVNQGMMEQLKQFTWDYPVILPEASSLRVDSWRASLQSVLWFFSHIVVITGFVLAGVVLWKSICRLLSGRK